MNKWNEKGVLESSVRYFYQVSQDAREYFFYPTWIGNYQCQFSYRIDRYYYPDFLVLFLNNGEFFLDYQQKKYHLKPGELFFIDCSKEHHYGAISNEVEFIFIHFNGKQVSELFNYLTKEESYVFDQRTSLQAGHILKQLIKACQKENVSLNANRFSVLIYDMLLSLNGNEHNPLIIEESMVSQSIKYIYEHIGKKISLEDLAQAAGISKYYFSHRFKEELGCSPMFYLKMVRIDVAKQLLQTTSLSVKEIAKFVGFENQNSFTQVFTKQVGCSPTYYKKYEGKK